MANKFSPLFKRSQFTVVVGCGSLGTSIADMMSDAGGGIVVIDRERDAFRKLSAAYGGMTLVGDATDIMILDEANLGGAGALIAVTGNDNTNIMVAQMAKELYRVPHVIARLFDPERECVYQEFGIETISPVVLSTREIKMLLRVREVDGEALLADN
ncbi:MAG: TrkA family potassium uptake protein [Oscillospiraceae bacterium]|jgi:trk system potassium uptake protein TrkA|nr:TrkA family potassium uptake protein [Oscillospiraceae bacterium]